MPYTRQSLDDILRLSVQVGASDVHLASGVEPRFRRDGRLVPIPEFSAEYALDELRSTLHSIMTDEQKATYDRDYELDLSYTLAGAGRFRVNVYRALDGIAAAFRLISDIAPSFASLGIPAIAADLARAPRGLVLVTGPTGSGKSTTLTAMVDLINSERDCHIITVEDPIEFLHTSKRALVTQREVGTDTRSFGEALRRILRQDPDVILVGELRDLETIQVALTAAETGQLVLATLHTQGAAKTINRIVDAFPAHQHSQVKSQLASTLKGVISQTLLRRAQGSGRVLATEVMVQTPAVLNLIREGEVQQLYSVMQTGSAQGMHTMDQSLRALVEHGVVSQREAQALLEDPRALDNVVVRVNDFDVDEWFQADGPQISEPDSVSFDAIVSTDRGATGPVRTPEFSPVVAPVAPAVSHAAEPVVPVLGAGQLSSFGGFPAPVTPQTSAQVFGEQQAGPQTPAQPPLTPSPASQPSSTQPSPIQPQPYVPTQLPPSFPVAPAVPPASTPSGAPQPAPAHDASNDDILKDADNLSALELLARLESRHERARASDEHPGLSIPGVNVPREFE